MIFIPPGTHKYPIQACLKDSVEVKAERVEPQRVVLHPGGHDQDNHLLIYCLERILWIDILTLEFDCLIASLSILCLLYTSDAADE